MQATLIPEQHKSKYKSARELASTVERVSHSWTADQYFLYFHGVVDDEYDVIEEELCEVQLSVPNRPVRTPGPWRPIVPSVPGGVVKDGGDGVRLV